MIEDPTELSILCHDETLLVVDKPTSLVMHRSSWADDDVTLVDLVCRWAKQKTVHPIGRLDRGTSGAVLFALNVDAARTLNAAKEQGRINKRYLALVRGCAPQRGVVDYPIPRRPGGPRVPARSAFCSVGSAAIEPRTLSLVDVATRGGRLHQVRRHLKHISHPIIGDSTYGKGALNREIAERYGLGRLALHARSIAFPHPQGGHLCVRAPLPADLTNPLLRMGFEPV